MVAITIGSGSFFKSITAEEHLLEICTYMQNQERNLSSNTTGKDFMQVSYNLNDMVTGISFSVPAEQSIDTAGKVVTNAIDYLQNISFTPGDGGTFKSITLSEYFLEVVTFLQIKEGSNTTNPQLANNVSSSYDADDKLFSGSISLPLSVNFDVNGHPVIIATQYLL